MTLIPRAERFVNAVNQAVKLAQKNPGQKLPNGGIIVCQRQKKEYWNDGSSFGIEFFVLAILPNNLHTPYCVWTRTIGVKEEVPASGFQAPLWSPFEQCQWGHYFPVLADALDHYLHA